MIYRPPVEDVGEPYEKTYSSKEQQRLEDIQEENRKVLRRLRHHLDKADYYTRIARDYLRKIENDNDVCWLEDAFLNLAASEKSNDDLV